MKNHESNSKYNRRSSLMQYLTDFAQTKFSWQQNSLSISSFLGQHLSSPAPSTTLAFLFPSSIPFSLSLSLALNEDWALHKHPTPLT